MNSNHLKKILQLIRRTGDKGIIPDEESDELFVLMAAKSYEKMLPPVLSSTANLPDEPSLGESTNDFVFDNAEPEALPRIAPEATAAVKKAPTEAPERLNFSEEWPPKQSGATNEESLSDVPHDGEEEEKFYLEPAA